MSSAPVLLALIDAAAERLRDSMVSVKPNGAVDGTFDGGMSTACRQYIQRAHHWEQQRQREAEQRFLARQEEEQLTREEVFQRLRRMVWQQAKEKSRLYMPVRSDLLPQDLREWAVRELRWSKAVMTRVCVYLVLRETLDHELAQAVPGSFGELQGDYSEATLLSTQAREHRGEPRRMRVEDEHGEEMFVEVTDAPGRNLDLRGWDRPEPGMTVLTETIEVAAEELQEDSRSLALRTKVVRAERPKVDRPRRKPAPSQFFINRNKQVFEFSNGKWFYKNMRVATAVSQKLHQQRAYGILRPFSEG